MFKGTRSEQMQLIGNAVPPRFAEVIGRTLWESLRGRPDGLAGGLPGELPGALLTFAPTASNGMSPALRATCEAVAERFGVGPAYSEERQALLWSGTN